MISRAALTPLMLLPELTVNAAGTLPASQVSVLLDLPRVLPVLDAW